MFTNASMNIYSSKNFRLLYIGIWNNMYSYENLCDALCVHEAIYCDKDLYLARGDSQGP